MTQFDHTADLQSLLATIAASPIVVQTPKARDFADWCRLQQPADIDLVILGWLRSQALQPRAQG
jgi:hypothetical protein